MNPFNILASEEVKVLTGHRDCVMAVTFSPDSRYLASASFDGTAIIWEAGSGRRLRSLVGHTDSVTAVAFGSDGGVLATGSFDGTAKLWEVATGDELMTLSGHTDWVMGLAFHPDSAWLATGSFDGTSKLWDLRTGREVRSFEGHRGGINAVAISPDGRLLATASEDRTVKIWDLFSGEEQKTIAGHKDAVRGVAFSPDGSLLATGSNDRTAAVWDLATRRETARLTGHKGWVYGVAFSTEGRYLATCSGDRSLRLWEAEGGRLVKTYSGHGEGVNGLAFSPDGWSLASAGDDRTIRIWPIPFQPIRRLPPNLYAQIEFNDENGDGILEAGETARVHLILRNEGQGPAQRVRITLEDDLTDPALSATAQSIRAIGSKGKSQATIILRAEMGVRTAQHRMRVRVREYYGYDMDPVYLVLKTKAISPPAITFSGLELEEGGPGTAAITVDGKLSLGESAVLKIYLQNTGLGLARGISYQVQTTDPNIFLDNAAGILGDFKPGEVRTIRLGISPNKRVVASGALPVYLTIRDRIGMLGLTNIQLPIEINKEPPRPILAAVKPDSSANDRAHFELASPKFFIIPKEEIDLSQFRPSSRPMPDAVAVVMGIGRYRHLPEVPWAAESARLMERYLRAGLGAGRVLCYTDQEASGLIFDELFHPQYGKLAREVGRGFNKIIFYYRGHLVPNKSGSELYLFPADGDPGKLEQEGYPLTNLYSSLGRLGASWAMVIVDAAYLPLEGKSDLKLINPKPWIVYQPLSSIVGRPGEEPARAAGTEFIVINACEGYRYAAPYEPGGAGLLTYYLAAGLKGLADSDGDGRITLGEIRRLVNEKVPERSWRVSGLQSPEVYGDDDRVIIECQ